MLDKALARTLLTAIALATVALAGCAGDDSPGDTTPDPDPAPPGNGGQDPAPSQPPSQPEPEPEPPTRYENATLGQSLADCSVISAIVSSGGDPAEAAADVATITLTEVDWGRPYTIELTDDATDGMFPASAICVGFDGVGSLSSGGSGTIPDETTVMLIGGDFVFSGNVFVTIG
jgi:hypothetical protein